MSEPEATQRKRRNQAARERVTSALRDGFEPISTTTLGGEVYDALCLALLNGTLQPGQPISIRDLAAAFSTSPMPVREAIRRLEAQGVLEARHGRAVTVPDLTAEDVQEIYTIRIALETLAAARAAEMATPEQLADIETIYDDMNTRHDRGDYPGFMETNHDFHMAIYRAAGNKRLVQQIYPHWLRITPFLWSLVEKRHLRFSMDRHREALDALKRRDSAALARAIRGDIEEAMRKLIALLSTD